METINNFGPEVEIVKQFYANCVSMENVEKMENNVENLAKFEQTTVENNLPINDNNRMEINNIISTNHIESERISIENETAETLANMEIPQNNGEIPKNNGVILCGCNSTLPGSLYCGDCQAVLCQVCINEHQNVPITQNHMLYSFVMQ